MKFKKLLALGAALVFSVALSQAAAQTIAIMVLKKNYPIVSLKVLTLNCLKKV